MLREKTNPGRENKPRTGNKPWTGINLGRDGTGNKPGMGNREKNLEITHDSEIIITEGQRNTWDGEISLQNGK